VCHRAAPERHRRNIKAHMHPPTFIPRCPHCMGEGFAWDRVPESCFGNGFPQRHCTTESLATCWHNCTADALGFLEALFHRALCTEWLVTAPQRPLGYWRHCSTEPYAPNGLPLHCRGFWVPGGTVPQSLFTKKGCPCSTRANDHGKANAYGDPPLAWDLVPEACFTWDLGAPPLPGTWDVTHNVSHT
jgi:hypothetical protein